MTRSKLRVLAAALVAGLTVSPAAQAWEEPARGTELRADLMDALRPIAEWNLGAPVEFAVHQLRVAGDAAFASVIAQRPGGVPIDITTTPIYQRGEIDPEIADGTTMQALYVRSGRMWVAVHSAIGATDVWYYYEDFCPTWGGVLTEFCATKN